MSSPLAHAALALLKATALQCRVLTLAHSEALSSHHLYLNQIRERKRIYISVNEAIFRRIRDVELSSSDSPRVEGSRTGPFSNRGIRRWPG